MIGNTVLILSAVAIVALPVAASAEGLDGGAQRSVAPSSKQTVTDGYGDRNRGGPYGFYSYPLHRHIDRAVADRGLSLDPGDPSHSYADRNQGSANYGRNYGAPYYGGSYYDGGTYYRERRD